MKKTEQILGKVKRIAPLPRSMLRLLQLCGEPNHSAQDVAKVVEVDEVLTAAVLRIVNSASYGLRQPILSVDRAVSYLGDQVILGIAAGSCASHIYSSALDGYESERGLMWSHSLYTAIAAREVAGKMGLNPGEAYTLGLIHDIGKTVLSEFLKGIIQETLSNQDPKKRKDFLAAERAAVGTDHCEVGALLCEQWKLPPVFRNVVKFHHSPSQAPESDRALTYAVHIADSIAMMAGIDTGLDAFGYPLDPGYETFIKLDRPTVEKLVFQAQMGFEKAKTALFGADNVSQEQKS